MSDAQHTSEKRFKKAEWLHFGDLHARTCTSDTLVMLEIERQNFGFLDTEEAKALRDYLNKVLP